MPVEVPENYFRAMEHLGLLIVLWQDVRVKAVYAMTVVPKPQNPGAPCERKLPARQHCYVVQVFGTHYGWPYAELTTDIRTDRRARCPNELLWSGAAPMTMTVLRGYNNHVLLVPLCMIIPLSIIMALSMTSMQVGEAVNSATMKG